jgi:hypothetical protein
VLDPAAAESRVAALPVAHTPASVPAERVDGKSRGKLWAAVVAAVVLLGGSALAYRLMNGGTAAPDPQPQPPALAPAPVASVDALRFMIEVRGKDGSTSRVSGKDPIGAKIDGWRLLFTPAARGRIAVIGPNERNIPTLFLPVSGEPLEPGASAVFPTRDWFHTTADTPSDTVTIVFIPEGAVKPAFVAGKEMRQLTVDEQRDLEQFRKTNAVAPQFGDDGATRIAAPEAGRPLAADVTVRY